MYIRPKVPAKHNNSYKYILPMYTSLEQFPVTVFKMQPVSSFLFQAAQVTNF